MAYKVDWYDKDGLVGTEHVANLPLASVKDHARNIVETGCGDRAEVRDTAGALVYHFPRVMHGA